MPGHHLKSANSISKAGNSKSKSHPPETTTTPASPRVTLPTASTRAGLTFNDLVPRRNGLQQKSASKGSCVAKVISQRYSDSQAAVLRKQWEVSAFSHPVGRDKPLRVRIKTEDSDQQIIYILQRFLMFQISCSCFLFVLLCFLLWGYVDFSPVYRSTLISLQRRRKCVFLRTKHKQRKVFWPCRKTVTSLSPFVILHYALVTLEKSLNISWYASQPLL